MQDHAAGYAAPPARTQAADLRRGRDCVAVAAMPAAARAPGSQVMRPRQG